MQAGVPPPHIHSHPMLAPIQRTLGIFAICCAALVSPAFADDASEINRLFSAGQVSEALTKLDTLIAARPRDPQLRFQKGVLLAEAKRRDEAAAVFTQLTIDFPEIPEPYNNLAVIYAAQSEYDRARAALEAAIRAKSDYAVAHQNLGDVYAQLAKISYTRALQLDPSSTAIGPKLSVLRDLVKTIPAAPPPAPEPSK
jgi:tetratricopeptide (TPR) repeat protein